MRLMLIFAASLVALAAPAQAQQISKADCAAVATATGVLAAAMDQLLREVRTLDVAGLKGRLDDPKVRASLERLDISRDRLLIPLRDFTSAAQEASRALVSCGG